MTFDSNTDASAKHEAHDRSDVMQASLLEPTFFSIVP